ncbi:MAG: hypothetical protein VCC04_04535, partial [Myxococcota bacterium]
MAFQIPKSIDELPTSEVRFVGRGIRRMEDPSLLTGRTPFIDDVVLPQMLHCAILRSPFPHAQITGIDTREAEELPGVVAVLTGEDVLRWSHPAQSAPEGWGIRCMATDKVRFVGEPVAAVAAISRYVAEDAAELIMVDYEPLEVIADPFEAMKPDAPQVMEEQGTNLMMDRVFNWGDVDQVFA